MTAEEARAYGAAARIVGRENIPGEDPEFTDAFVKLVDARESFALCMDLLCEWGYGWRETDQVLRGGIPISQGHVMHGDPRDPKSWS